MSDGVNIGLALFLQPSHFFVRRKSLELLQAFDPSREEVEAKERQGYDCVTLEELRKCYPGWGAIYEQLEKLLADEGSA